MNPTVAKLKKKRRNKNLNIIRCCNCGTLIKTTDRQTKSCKCGDVTVFQRNEGKCEVAYRSSGAYEIVRKGWTNDGY